MSAGQETALDVAIRWYNGVQINNPLGFGSPAEYRRNLGIATWRTQHLLQRVAEKKADITRLRKTRPSTAERLGYSVTKSLRSRVAKEKLLTQGAQAGGQLPNIALPVFTRFVIGGYELFPGAARKGLDREILPGVTVVAGINGLGKTTLLNIMLRLLVGPFNPQKLNPFEVGAASHELVRWKGARRFFSSRVSDGAVHAVASVAFQIGTHEFKLSRNLKDLQLIFLEYDGQELEPTEAEYERVALDASNAASRYDFDFLVRYLVFFLEQRTPLFWNERGQVETFRILLCDSELASAFQAKEDEIRTKDSLFRNVRWHANSRISELANLQAQYAASSGQAAKASALQAAAKALRERESELIQEIAALSDERSSLRTRSMLAKIELEEAYRANEALQQGYLSKIFPPTAEAARYVFGTLLGSGNCAVCGCRAERGRERVNRLLNQGICPACESPPQEQERPVDAAKPSAEDMKCKADEVVRLQHSVAGLGERDREVATRLQELFTAQSALSAERAVRATELQAIHAQLPPTPQELQALQLRVESDADEVRDRQAELERLYAEYEALLTSVGQRVSQMSSKIQEAFSRYAQAFLAERCHLGEDTYKETLGESRSFSYPCFNVYMTSAVSPERETVRHEIEDVSESQREFIDLAFRMALISAATPEQARAMLIIETPEASLDAYFIDQAGDMLRSFAADGHNGKPGNVVIVSSNLASQNMIGALLGFGQIQSKWPSASTVRRRLINLLDESAPNAALRDHRAFYEQALHAATHDRLKSGNA